jgi:cytochrome c-type biogenesis protein
VVALFLVYAAGMGLVVVVITLGTALARDAVATWLRRALPYVTRLSGALLALAGLYVAYYGWFELRVFAGASAEGTVFNTANRIQGELTRTLQDIGPGWFVGALVVLLAAGALLGRLRAKRARRDNAPSPHG